VTSGAVQLEAVGRPASLVSAGASCRIAPDDGPGVPWFLDAPKELHDLDPTDEAAVESAIRAARPDDVLTLWHVLPRVPRELRGRVFDRMVALEPAPDAIHRDAILDLDETQLAAWRDALDPWSGAWK
jgi:hypothetical protein